MLVFDAMNTSVLDAGYLGKLRAGGIDAIHASVIWEREGFRETVRKIEQCRTELAVLEHQAALAFSVADIRRAKANDRVAVVLGLQNTSPTEDDEVLLSALHRLGVRIVQLTYNERNLVGDGCTERRDAGLSDFGVRVVRQLNALRVAVDVSHAGEQTLLDAVAESSAPVICSHANARAICKSPRNLSDHALLTLARRGGVVGVTSFGPFVKETSPDIEHFLDHIDYLVRLVGPEQVGIGSDLAEGRTLPAIDGGTYKTSAYPDPSWRRARGLESASEMPNVVSGLRRRGYADDDIGRIMGGNFLRVLGEIWSA